MEAQQESLMESLTKAREDLQRLGYSSMAEAQEALSQLSEDISAYLDKFEKMLEEAE